MSETKYIKRLTINGKLMPQETCEILKTFSDGTCLVKNEDGETRLFRQDMLSDEPTEEVYLELKDV